MIYKIVQTWLKRFFYKLPDLSRGFMDPSIPVKQREIVDAQLQKMYNGEAPAHFRVLAKIFDQIESSDIPLRLLDAGCASGYYYEILNHLIQHQLNYHGSDYSLKMLEMAQQKYPKIPFLRMDLRHLGWIDKAFDVVLSGAVIEHIREWDKAVSEIARVSKTWIILHRTRIMLNGPTKIHEEPVYDVPIYRVSIGENEIISHLSKLGFSLVSNLECNEGNLGDGIGNFTYLFSRRQQNP